MFITMFLILSRLNVFAESRYKKIFSTITINDRLSSQKWMKHPVQISAQSWERKLFNYTQVRWSAQLKLGTNLSKRKRIFVINFIGNFGRNFAIFCEKFAFLILIVFLYFPNKHPRLIKCLVRPSTQLFFFCF